MIDGEVEMLKKVLLVILGVILVLVACSYILPDQYSVSRITFIAATAEEVHEVVSDLTTWQEWTVWNKSLDPGLEVEYSIKESVVGSSSSWTGDSMEPGTMEIISAEPGRGIVYTLEFEGMPAAQGVIQITQMKGGSEVLWMMDGIAMPPLGPYMIGFIESIIGNDFDAGLKNLKERLQ